MAKPHETTFEEKLAYIEEIRAVLDRRSGDDFSEKVTALLITLGATIDNECGTLGLAADAVRDFGTRINELIADAGSGSRH